jgi:Flp pilus assembly protein TadD
MRRFSGFAFPTLALAYLFLSFCQPLCAQKPPLPPTRPSPTISTTFSVSGRVSDAGDNTRINSVRVELRAFSGATVSSAFTSGDGNFEFLNVARGSYQLVVQQMGYQSSAQPVDVNGSVIGIEVILRRIAGPGGVSGGPATVSARELSIPHKAHDAMEKGLSLLYTKSDYAGSVKQFERAVQAYPEYYEAYTQIGVANMKLHDVNASEQAFRKAIDISHQQNVDALFWLATVLSDGERFTDAEPLARKAVEVDANSWQAHEELARALLGLNRAPEAETAALEAVKLQPQNANLRLLLANIHIALENNGALLDDLNAYLKLAPTGSFAAQARKQRDEVQHNLENSKASPVAPSAANP